MSAVESLAQSGILAGVPRFGRHLFFDLGEPRQMPACLERVASEPGDGAVVVGIGSQTLRLRGDAVLGIPGLRAFPALQGEGASAPSTPVALWLWLRGEDPGTLVRRGHALGRQLAPGFVLRDALDTFRHGRGPNGLGLDLTGYEDGTENPEPEAAPGVALLQGCGPGLDGASYAAIQQWVHDFDAFEALSTQERDHTMGRRLTDNAEIDDAPPSAHVKRTAQESFDPEAFVLRRSMPWSAGREAGLLFLAFGRSFDAYEAQLRRMVGLEDGIVDGLFRVSKPRTGAYLWCPPMRDGRLDLRALGL